MPIVRYDARTREIIPALIYQDKQWNEIYIRWNNGTEYCASKLPSEYQQVFGKIPYYSLREGTIGDRRVEEVELKEFGNWLLVTFSSLSPEKRVLSQFNLPMYEIAEIEPRDEIK